PAGAGLAFDGFSRWRSAPAENQPPTKKAATRAAFSANGASRRRRSLGCFQLIGSQLPALGHDFVLDALAFGQRSKSRTLHGADMDENVLTAAFRCNKAEPLRGVEEFDSSCSHYLASVTI